jgi:putative endonuclease
VKPSHALGRSAEDRAAVELEAAGYRILKRNFRAGGAEIDIIAAEDGFVVFVEVKARQTSAFASAIAAVDAKKRRKIRAAAEEFLQFYAPDAKARYDVVSFDGGRMRLHRNAF